MPILAAKLWKRKERLLHCTPKENTFLTCEASDAHWLEHAWSALDHRITGFVGAADNGSTNELWSVQKDLASAVTWNQGECGEEKVEYVGQVNLIMHSCCLYGIYCYKETPVTGFDEVSNLIKTE